MVMCFVELSRLPLQLWNQLHLDLTNLFDFHDLITIQRGHFLCELCSRQEAGVTDFDLTGICIRTFFASGVSTSTFRVAFEGFDEDDAHCVVVVSIGIRTDGDELEELEELDELDEETFFTRGT